MIVNKEVEGQHDYYRPDEMTRGRKKPRSMLEQKVQAQIPPPSSTDQTISSSAWSVADSSHISRNAAQPASKDEIVKNDDHAQKKKKKKKGNNNKKKKMQKKKKQEKMDDGASGTVLGSALGSIASRQTHEPTFPANFLKHPASIAFDVDGEGAAAHEQEKRPTKKKITDGASQTSSLASSRRISEPAHPMNVITYAASIPFEFVGEGGGLPASKEETTTHDQKTRPKEMPDGASRTSLASRRQPSEPIHPTSLITPATSIPFDVDDGVGFDAGTEEDTTHTKKKKRKKTIADGASQTTSSSRPTSERHPVDLMIDCVDLPSTKEKKTHEKKKKRKKTTDGAASQTSSSIASRRTSKLIYPADLIKHPSSIPFDDVVSPTASKGTTHDDEQKLILPQNLIPQSERKMASTAGFSRKQQNRGDSDRWQQFDSEDFYSMGSSSLPSSVRSHASTRGGAMLEKQPNPVSKTDMEDTIALSKRGGKEEQIRSPKQLKGREGSRRGEAEGNSNTDNEPSALDKAASLGNFGNFGPADLSPSVVIKEPTQGQAVATNFDHSSFRAEEDDSWGSLPSLHRNASPLPSATDAAQAEEPSRGQHGTDGLNASVSNNSSVRKSSHSDSWRGRHGTDGLNASVSNNSSVRTSSHSDSWRERHGTDGLNASVSNNSGVRTSSHSDSWRERHGTDGLNASVISNNSVARTSSLSGSYGLVQTSAVDVLTGAELVDDPLVAAEVGNHTTEVLTRQIVQEEGNKRRLLLTSIGMFVTFLGAIVAVLVVFFLGARSDPTPSPTPSPTSLQEASWIGLIQTRMSSTTFDDPNSPQRRALDWMSQDSLTMTLDDNRIVQRFALVVLYYSTNGTIREWVESSSECGWGEDQDDVGCTNGTVVSIALNGGGLSGSIPEEIGLLTSLTFLSLRKNNLEGTIPTEIGRLTSLTVLDSSSNDLEGTLPTELGRLTLLTVLNFRINDLGGAIPSELGQMDSLLRLNFANNSLSGSIPSESMIASLTWLSLSRNDDLTGLIPTEIAQLSNLTALYLASNKLSGTIPSNLCNTLENAYVDCPDIECDCCTCF